MQRLVVHTLVFVFALFVVGQLLFRSAEQSHDRRQPATLVLKTEPGPQARFGGDTTVIERAASGQFHMRARVNGTDTEFLVDTGADIVALTGADAERLCIDVSPSDFQPIMQTASGIGNGARVQLDRLELGDDEFRDVNAVVVEGLQVNLLGQSVLRRFGKVELQGDRMVIEHR